MLDDGSVRPFLQAFEDGLGRLFIDTAPFRVEAALGIPGLPLGADEAVLMKEIGFDDVIRDGDEVVQFPLTADDEGQGRRLDAADGKDDAVSLTAGGQGIGPGQIHADEPVGAAAGQGRFLEMDEIAVAAQIVEGFVDALLVEGIQEDPFDRLLIADVIEDLIDEQLPFPVRVTGVDDSIDVGVGDEVRNDLELVLTGQADQELPLLGDNRQVVGVPALVLGIIILRLGLLQDVAISPGHDAAARADTAVPPLVRIRQALRQFPGHARLFGNKKFHKASLFLK